LVTLDSKCLTLKTEKNEKDACDLRGAFWALFLLLEQVIEME
jgi:hypothetical protein